MLMFRLIFLFWVTTRIGLHVLELEKHIGLLTLLLHFIPPLSETLCCSSSLLNTLPPLIGQLKHA